MIHLTLILLNILCAIYSVPKESKDSDVCLRMNDGIHCVLLLFCCRNFGKYLISGILFLDKKTIIPRFVISKRSKLGIA